MLSSSTSAKTGTAGVTTVDSGNKTGLVRQNDISQIRDNVDQMPTSGQLTAKQQMSLIDSGLQDLNPYDKSYQTSDPSVGLSRATTGTFDAAAIMNQKATFATADGENELAGLNASIATMFAEREKSSSLSFTV